MESFLSKLSLRLEIVSDLDGRRMEAVEDGEGLSSVEIQSDWFDSSKKQWERQSLR